MPFIGRDHAANINKNEMFEDRSHELGEYRVTFMETHQPVALGELLKGLPDDMCQSHHWGVVEAGEVTFEYKDGSVEVAHAGDAFYIRPGHKPHMSQGTRMTMFSPSAEMALTDEAVQRNLEASR